MTAETTRRPKTLKQLRTETNRTYRRWQHLRDRYGRSHDAVIDAEADYLVASDILELAQAEAEQADDDWPGW